MHTFIKVFPARSLITALLLIDEKYDGIDNYIKNVLKVDDEMIQSLRELYLEPKKASK